MSTISKLILPPKTDAPAKPREVTRIKGPEKSPLMKHAETCEAVQSEFWFIDAMVAGSLMQMERWRGEVSPEKELAEYRRLSADVRACYAVLTTRIKAAKEGRAE